MSEKPEFGEGSKKRETRAIRTFQSPNLIILSRADKAPLPGLHKDDEKPEKPKAEDEEQPEEQGKKRELRGMSAKSSLNISKVLSSLDWTKNGKCIHVTLTYWKAWPPNKKALAKAKATIVAMVGRYFKCGIWRLEYQSRKKPTAHKVPHWHLLLWLGDYDLDDSCGWLEKWWAKFADNSSPHACKITLGDQARGTWYLAMHAAKKDQSPPFAVGRWWGYVNREALLKAQDIHATATLTDRELVWWARLYRRATGCRTRDNKGFSWFLPNHEQWRAAAWIRDYLPFEKVQDAELRKQNPKLKAMLQKGARLKTKS